MKKYCALLRINFFLLIGICIPSVLSAAQVSSIYKPNAKSHSFHAPPRNDSLVKVYLDGKWAMGNIEYVVDELIKSDSQNSRNRLNQSIKQSLSSECLFGDVYEKDSRFDTLRNYTTTWSTKESINERFDAAVHFYEMLISSFVLWGMAQGVIDWARDNVRRLLIRGVNGVFGNDQNNEEEQAPPDAVGNRLQRVDHPHEVRVDLALQGRDDVAYAISTIRNNTADNRRESNLIVPVFSPHHMENSQQVGSMVNAHCQVAQATAESIEKSSEDATNRTYGYIFCDLLSTFGSLGIGILKARK